MFLLRNPANQAASTHAGVLEFIADEGFVHLPHWVGAAGLNPTILPPYFFPLDDEDLKTERRRPHSSDWRTIAKGQVYQATSTNSGLYRSIGSKGRVGIPGSL